MRERANNGVTTLFLVVFAVVAVMVGGPLLLALLGVVK